MEHSITPAAAKSGTLAELATNINAEHDAALAAARSAIEHARRCGELLIEAKRQIGHGGFLPWLTANCRVGERQARNYMRVAEHWETITAKSEPGSDLTIKGALNLIAKSQRDERAATKSPPDLGSRIGELRRLAYEVYGCAEDRGVGHALPRLMRELADEMDRFTARPPIKTCETIPDLSSGDVLRCAGAGDTMALIIPIGKGYYYVGIANLAAAYVDEIARGVIGHAVPEFFRRHKFVADGDWQRSPITDDDRQYVAEAREHRAAKLYARQPTMEAAG